jgi:hypothetical protein
LGEKRREHRLARSEKEVGKHEKEGKAWAHRPEIYL